MLNDPKFGIVSRLPLQRSDSTFGWFIVFPLLERPICINNELFYSWDWDQTGAGRPFWDKFGMFRAVSRLVMVRS